MERPPLSGTDKPSRRPQESESFLHVCREETQPGPGARTGSPAVGCVGRANTRTGDEFGFGTRRVL